MSKRGLVIGGIGFVLLLGGCVGAYFLFFQPQRNEPSGTEILGRPVTAAQINESIQDVYISGGASAAIKQYNAEIERAKSDKDVAELKRGKASIHMNEGDYDEALKVAKEADAAASSRFTSGLVADIYFLQGNKNESIRYYNQAIERVKTDEYQTSTFNDEAYYTERRARAEAL